MEGMLRDLVLHKAYANAELLKAVCRNETAAADSKLREMLHHIIVANRYWLFLILGIQFDVRNESIIPASPQALAELFREIEKLESDWLDRLDDAESDRAIESSYHASESFSVHQAMMQVCMHSAGHRAQCATRLREMGVTPPRMDFIMWLKDRPTSDWNWLPASVT